jgi:quercetin dioxygenase-like cupin family protein
MSHITRLIPAVATTVLLLPIASAAWAQGTQAEGTTMILAAPGTATYGPIAGFPKGTDIAVVRGDPGKGAFDAYIRLQPGVRIPVHFHSSAESAVGVKGNFTLEMKDGTKKALAAGMYTFIPWQMPHAASCPAGGAACIGFFVFDKAFDVTWVEAPPTNPNPMPSPKN